MFAALLPGIRELRVPLAVGFLWMAVLWTATSAFLRSPPEESFLSDLASLAEWISAPVFLVALSFVAYLVGIGLRPLVLTPLVRKVYSGDDSAAMTDLTRFVTLELTKAQNRGVKAREVLKSFPVLEEQERSRFSDEAREELVLERAAEISTQNYRPALDDVDNAERWEWLLTKSSELANDAVETSARFADYLLMNHRDAFDKLDRSLAEAEFRESIAVPLVFAVSAIATRVSFETGVDWALFAIPAVIILSLGLSYSALLIKDEADQTMSRYIVSKNFSSPVIDIISNSQPKDL